MNILGPDLAPSRLCEISRYDVLLDIETWPSSISPLNDHCWHWVGFEQWRIQCRLLEYMTYLGVLHLMPRWRETHWHALNMNRSVDVINTLRPRQNGRHFPDDICKCIFVNENVGISIKISLKFVPISPINNIPALVQIMAWRRPGDKPLSEPVMVSLLTHISVTRPQWVNTTINYFNTHASLSLWRLNAKCHLYHQPDQ